MEFAAINITAVYIPTSANTKDALSGITDHLHVFPLFDIVLLKPHAMIFFYIISYFKGLLRFIIIHIIVNDCLYLKKNINTI